MRITSELLYANAVPIKALAVSSAPRTSDPWRPALAVALLTTVCVGFIPNAVFAVVAPDRSVVQHFGADDVYYYFQIARRISSGEGSSFDGLTRTNGFHPLWMLVCVAIFSVTPDGILPLRIVLVLSAAIGSLAFCVLILAFARLHVHPWGVTVAAMFFMLSPDWNFALADGSEFAINLCAQSAFIAALALCLAGRWSIDKRKAVGLGLLAGIVFLARLDNVFLLAVASLTLVWKLGRKGNVRPFLWVLGAILGMYVVFNYVYYGGVRPVSGQVKQYWAEVGGSVFGNYPASSLESVKIYFSKNSDVNTTGPIAYLHPILSLGTGSDAVATAVLALALVGAISGPSWARWVASLLVLGSVAQATYYGWIGYVQARSWYWAGAAIAVMVGLSMCFGRFSESRQRRALLVRWVIAGLVVGLLMPGYLRDVQKEFAFAPSDGADYLDRARFLDDETPLGAIIGTPNAGGLGYYSRRRIVNIDGLVNSYEYLEAMKAGTAGDYLAGLGVGYIFIGPGYIEYEPYKRMLAGRLTLAGSWVNADGARRHDLFRFR